MKTRERAYTKKRNNKQIRLPFVAKYHKLGLSMQDIADKVKEDLELARYVKSTVKSDIDFLHAEWRESRMLDTDELINMELQRNYTQMREAWDAWEKSKTDYKQKFQKQKGEMTGKGPDGQSIKTKDVERGEKDMNMFGDPRYLAEMRMLADQRIKLLGLNAPEKKEITGEDGAPLFAKFDEFMDTCLKDAQQAQSNQQGDE